MDRIRIKILSLFNIFIRRFFRITLPWLLSFIVIGTLANSNSFLIKAGGSAPWGTCLNITNANPRWDPLCGHVYWWNSSVCYGTCLYYCPMYLSNWAKVRLNTDIQYLSLRISKSGDSGEGIRVIVKDSSTNVVIDKHVHFSGEYVTVTDNSGRIFHGGDYIYLKLIDYDDAAGYYGDKGVLGFRHPQNGTTFLCGENDVAKSGSDSCPPPADWQHCSKYYCQDRQSQVDFSWLLDGLDNARILDKMCVADTPLGDSDFDFDDMGVVLFGYAPGTIFFDPWLRTSIGLLYSKKGFDGLPKYFNIRNVIETPDTFKDMISPFNSTDSAVLSTFVVMSNDDSGMADIDYGYDGHHRENLGDSFLSSNIVIPNKDWSTFLVDSILNYRNQCINDKCRVFNVATASDLVNALAFSRAGARPDDILKLIFIPSGNDKKTLNLPDPTVIRGKNIIMLSGENSINIYQLLKKDKIDNSKVGALFIASGNSKIIIDDHKDKDYDGNNVDVVQAGFIILNDATFNVLQGKASHNRAAYRDGSGNFDRLILHGFLYSQTPIVLERDLEIKNEFLPSEWFIYDANLMNLFEPVLGKRKIQTTNCIMSNSPLCKN